MWQVYRFNIREVFGLNTVAYIHGEFTKEQFKELEEKEVTSIFIDVPRQDQSIDQTGESLDKIVRSLSSGDKLIIHDLTTLNRTLNELAIFLKTMKDKNIDLVILNKEEEFNSLTDSEFLGFIVDLYKENQKLVKEKTKKSTTKSQNVGRPKLSQKKINKIRDLRLNKKFTLQDTAKLCGVSAGTVYKYADSQKDKTF